MIRYLSKWKIAVFAIYVFLVAIGLWYHEIWNDEAQALLIVRDSPSFLSMLSELRYENNGLLWHLLLYPIVKLGGGVMAMQVLHLIIAACIALVILSLDMPWFFSVLMIFGYYFFYEYAIVSRCYGLAVLFLFLAARDLRKDGSLWRVGLLLGLASLASNHALLLVVTFLPWFLWSEFHKSDWQRRVVSFMIPLAICFGLVLPFVIPPVDGVNHVMGFGKYFYANYTMSEYVLQGALLPLPQFVWPQIEMWYTAYSGVIWGGWLALIVASAFVFFFAGKRSGAIFLTGALALIAFCSILYFGGMRHHGFIWVWMLFALIIEPEAFKKIAANRFGKVVFLTFLILQVPRGLTMWTCDLIYPFSQSKAVAAWLVKETPSPAQSRLRMGGINLQSVSAYLGEPFYSLLKAGPGSYDHWSTTINRPKSNICMSSHDMPDLWILPPSITPTCAGFDFVEVSRFLGKSMDAPDTFWILKRKAKAHSRLP